MNDRYVISVTCVCYAIMWFLYWYLSAFLIVLQRFIRFSLRFIKRWRHNIKRIKLLRKWIRTIGLLQQSFQLKVSISLLGMFYRYVGERQSKNLWLKLNHLKFQNKPKIFISKNLFLFLHLFVTWFTWFVTHVIKRWRRRKVSD